MLTAIKGAWERDVYRPETFTLNTELPDNLYLSLKVAPRLDLTGLKTYYTDRYHLVNALADRFESLKSSPPECEQTAASVIDYFLSDQSNSLSLVGANELLVVHPNKSCYLSVKRPLKDLCNQPATALVKELDTHWASDRSLCPDQEFRIGEHGLLKISLIGNPLKTALNLAPEVTLETAREFLATELLKLSLAPVDTDAILTVLIDWLVNERKCKFMKGEFPGVGFFCLGYQGVIQCRSLYEY